MPAAAGPHLSNARFQALTEALPALVFVADTLGKNTFVNGWAAAYIGKPRNDLLGDAWLQFVHPEDREHALESLRRALSTGESYSVEMRFRRADGEYRMHACRAEPMRTDSGEVFEWLGVCIDVEEHRRAEAALREHAAELQTLLDTLPVGVLIARDRECRWIVGNRAAAELLRLPVDANLSKSARSNQVPTNFRILRNGREIPPEQLPVQRAARGEIIVAEEVDHAFADGRLVHTLVSARPLYDASGHPRGAVGAILDLTELKSIEASDRRKAEFLAELGHELRNALAPLATAADMLRRGGLQADHADALVATMGRQLAYLVGLVDELLDVARIGRGEVALQRAPIDLRAVADGAVEIARPFLLEHRNELAVSHPPQPLPVHGDARRLTQVIVNLLTNAAKYGDGGTIELSTSRDHDDVVLCVRDTGLGIPPDQLESIFRMFTRVPARRGRAEVAGLGVGLALARRLVVLHGGSIVAHSEGLGRGSEFVVRLPAMNAAALARAPTAGPCPAVATAPRRVLVVDDNVDAAETLRLWLEIEGHEVQAVHDGDAALEALTDFSPDLVLLDIGLPSMDGYEVARRMRAASGRQIVLAALTGWGQSEDRKRAIEAGFDHHLTKPVDLDGLRALLAEPRPATP